MRHGEVRIGHPPFALIQTCQLPPRIQHCLASALPLAPGTPSRSPDRSARPRPSLVRAPSGSRDCPLSAGFMFHFALLAALSNAARAFSGAASYPEVDIPNIHQPQPRRHRVVGSVLLRVNRQRHLSPLSVRLRQRVPSRFTRTEVDRGKIFLLRLIEAAGSQQQLRPRPMQKRAIRKDGKPLIYGCGQRL